MEIVENLARNVSAKNELKKTANKSAQSPNSKDIFLLF